MPSTSIPRESRPVLRIALKLALLLAVLAGLYFGGAWLLHTFHETIAPYYERWRYPVLLIALVVFTLLLAIPFVPGMEIGLSLMLMFGMQGVFFVYVATLVALSMSFLAGRGLPIGAIAWLLGWLHLHKARELALKLDALGAEDKLNFLVEIAPVRLIPFLLRHRYLTIALVLNLPGNFLIGGGGGIGLLAGLSGIFAYPWYLAAAALAISPVPLLFLVQIRFLPF